MANQDDLQQKLRMGIEAARRGDKAAAQLLLRQVVDADRNNELAWMWLASAVDSLDERRACLQHALRINPDNARAREALRRLQPGGASAAPRQRRAPRPAATTAEGRGGTSPVTILVAIVVGVAVLAALVFAVVSTRQPAALSNNELAAALTASVTPSPNPRTFTATPSPFMILVTPNITLPPTFTPTFTATPSETPLPSPTPYPLSAFRMLYTGLEPGQAVAALYAAAGDGTGESSLGPDVSDITFDPSGERVAFIRQVGAAPEAASAPSAESEDSTEEPAPPPAPRIITELFIAPADNLGAAVQVTDFGSHMSSPTWAPNGIQLAVVSDYDGDDDIWTLTDDGKNVNKLTENESVDRDPAWSPDGSRIIYVSDQDSPGLTRLYSMTADGQDITRLNSLGGNTYQPAWSPDGSRMVFVNDSNGDGDVYIADSQGESTLLLTTDDGGAEDRHPVFTPDSKWVAFASNRGGDNFQIFIMDLHGTVLTRLTNDGRDEQEVIYRPELLLRLESN